MVRNNPSTFVLLFFVIISFFGDAPAYGRLHAFLKRKDGPDESSTTQSLDVPTPTLTSASSVRTLDDSETFSGNPATIPTPRTTTFATDPVALFVPQVDPKVKQGPYQVQYLGPGNALATVYQVVYSSEGQTSPPVTATLIEDASKADLIGAQQATVLSDGTPTTIWAAASCDFATALGPTPGAASCVYFNKVGPVSSKWLTADATVSPQTTITPTPSAIQSSIALTAIATSPDGTTASNAGNTLSLNSSSFYSLVSFVACTLLFLHLS